jgi:16S rRNA (guanine527-N7)-methyltransferase
VTAAGPRPPLDGVLAEARALGFLGPDPIEAHIAHSHAFAAAAGPPPDRVLDLGSGGGVPGLVLSELWPSVRLVLLDASARRTAFLRAAIAALGRTGRVEAVRGRAEELGRDHRYREAFGLVVARSFGRPAVTAECGAGFVAPGGRLVVSEPPDAGERSVRWPQDRLPVLSLGPARAVERNGAHFVELRKTSRVDERYPRRTGIPAKRPLWS